MAMDSRWCPARDHLGNMYPSMTHMARAYGTYKDIIDRRLDKGWTIEQALTIPLYYRGDPNQAAERAKRKAEKAKRAEERAKQKARRARTALLTQSEWYKRLFPAKAAGQRS